MPSLKVMTWNVENLFRPKRDAAQAERDRFKRKLSLLSGVITNASPDVVALQEAGGGDAIDDLQRALGGTYPHGAVSTKPDARGIRVAFLSKHPIDDHDDIVNFPAGPALDIHGLKADGSTPPITEMGRGALRIRVTKGGLTVDVITAHLKSKLLSYPTSGPNPRFSPHDENERAQVAGIALLRRTAEAATLRIVGNALLESNTRHPLLLLGDFNDVPEAQTSLILCGPEGSEIGSRGFNMPDEGDNARLFNLAPAIAVDRRYSRVEQGRKELLDQIFASQEFFPRGADNRRQLPTVDSLIDFEGTLPSISGSPNERAHEVAPDHAPVVATFQL